METKEELEEEELTVAEWESLLDDHGNGAPLRFRGLSGISLLRLSLSALPRLPFSLRIPLLLFLENRLSRSRSPLPLSLLLPPLVSSLRSSPDPFSLQLLISTTSLFITNLPKLPSEEDSNYETALEGLINILLNVANRPNHGPDRQARGLACECLRELERARPCLLSGIVGPLWGLCVAERSHVAQSYVLLLATVVCGVVVWRPVLPPGGMNAEGSVVPFGNAFRGLRFGGEVPNAREVRRVVSFLMECFGGLSAFGSAEFVSMMVPIGVAMGLQASLMKVQFSGMLYVSEPVMCHAYLTVFARFAEAFGGEAAEEVVRRLSAVSKETQGFLVFRMLALHWVLGLVGKGGSVRKMVDGFYPNVFDPLALKSLKIDLLAYCSISRGDEEDFPMEKVFEDGIVSVSAFKWLPSWSAETAVSLRAFHKFLIGTSSHDDTTDLDSTRALMLSPIFKTIQKSVVELTVEYKGLVPVYVSFIDRLLCCDKHRWLGERLLQTFDEHLLPKLKKDWHRLTSYFPIFEKIAENDTIPPYGLIELLTHFVIFLVEKHGPDTELRTWSRGSKVLGICRIMLMHHHSSRLFIGLSRLLAFTCLYFPDLEVRDDARIYLRMLICIPGKKLRHILLSGDLLLGVTPAPQSTSFFNVQSQAFPDTTKSKTISSYIHLLRVVPLLVKQSWSLSLSTLGIGIDKDNEPLIEQPDDVEQHNNNIESNNLQLESSTDRIEYPPEPLRVMDSKISEMIGSLRRHFSNIPDFRHMAGLKIKIPCDLLFESEPFNRVWGSESPINASDPAMYAVVLKFSSSAPYGSIPSQHIPFLLGEIERKSHPLTDSLDIVPIGGVSIKNDSRYKARAFVELEPREPVPGLVYVSIEANTEDGQIIHGQLEDVNVGIEDMFLNCTIPFDVSKDERPNYCLNLFNSLWEACGSSSNIAHETFSLKNGKGVAAISGTRSVKLVEVPFMYLIQCVEQYLAPFVVSVGGEPLVDIVKEGGMIKDVVWKDFLDDVVSNANIDTGPLYLKYTEEEEERKDVAYVSKKKNMGCFRFLIFLPPRFHLLLQMEVSDVSTLVRIRTDHWPCLAYIDDYLEALFSL